MAETAITSRLRPSSEASHGSRSRSFLRGAQASGPLLLLGGLYAVIENLYLAGGLIEMVAAVLIVYALVAEPENGSRPSGPDL